MEITQIVIDSSQNVSVNYLIFGLGNDQEIYSWSYTEGKWIKYKKSK